MYELDCFKNKILATDEKKFYYIGTDGHIGCKIRVRKCDKWVDDPHFWDCEEAYIGTGEYAVCPLCTKEIKVSIDNVYKVVCGCYTKEEVKMWLQGIVASSPFLSNENTETSPQQTEKTRPVPGDAIKGNCRKPA